MTFKCDLDLQPTYTNLHMAFLLLKENNCAILFRNTCINVQVMAQPSSIYDHFIIWPSSATLTVNLPQQMILVALLLLKEQLC